MYASRLDMATRRARMSVFIVLALSALAWVAVIPALAATTGGAEIDWFQLGMGLFGGLSLFLLGMDQMSDGLKAAAGDSLKNVLAKLTTNRFSGALTGAFVTAVLNSSSVTTVLVVGFITAGIMTLAQSIGVIMGANIGSTVTAQIVAFNITQYALLPVAVGFGMMFTAKTDRTRYYGMMIMGLGLVFFGMGVMSQAMNPLRSYEPFLDLMQRMENPLLGRGVGAVFTAMVQSSAATTGIAIVMASDGLMSLPAGIALSLGANIGTCATALLASIGKPTEAVRAAVAHIFFNVAGVLLWVGFIGVLADLVVEISPSYPDLEGKARAAAEVPRQIANAHTAFNVVNTLVFIGFTTQIARLVEWLVPEKAPNKGVIVEPRFLDPVVADTPSMALQQIRLEFGHMGEIARSMYDQVRPALMERNRDLLEEIGKQDDQVDLLNDAMLKYMQEVRRNELTDHQSVDFRNLLSATDNLESLADVIETDLTEIGSEIIERDIEVSDTTSELLREFYDTVGRALELAVRAVRDEDQTAAQDVLALKSEVHSMVDKVLERKAVRIGEEGEGYLAVVRLEMGLIDKLRRIYTLAKRIAKVALPEELARKD